MKRHLVVFLLAAAGCATAPSLPSDPVLAQLTSSARAAYDRGDHRKATGFYQEALQRARARDDRAELPGIAASLAACQLAQGQTDGVAMLLAEARRERAQAGQRADDLDLLDASRLRAAGDTAGATALARRVAASSPDRDRVREAWLLCGLLAVEARDGTAVDAVLDKLGADRDPLADLLRGEARMLKNDATGAGPLFDQSAEGYRKAGRPAEMTKALARAGAAHRQAGQATAAADRFYRAARSAFARGDLVSALNHIHASLESLDEQDDPVTRTALASLFQEIEKAMPARPVP